MAGENNKQTGLNLNLWSLLLYFLSFSCFPWLFHTFSFLKLATLSPTFSPLGNDLAFCFTGKLEAVRREFHKLPTLFLPTICICAQMLCLPARGAVHAPPSLPMTLLQKCSFSLLYHQALPPTLILHWVFSTNIQISPLFSILSWPLFLLWILPYFPLFIL